MLPIVVAQTPSGGVLIRYAFPVFWMTSFPVGDASRVQAQSDSPEGSAGPGRSVISTIALLTDRK